MIYKTNFNLTARLLDALAVAQDRRLRPCGQFLGIRRQRLRDRPEDALPAPNSDYAVSKVACANLLSYYGKPKRFPCVNLAAVFGLRSAGGLVAADPQSGPRGRGADACPSSFAPDISRDFVYIDDVCEAFVDARARAVPRSTYGESFNIGTRPQDDHRRGGADRAIGSFSIAEPSPSSRCPTASGT